MRKDEFLEQLRSSMSGIPPAAFDEIIADYTAHFAEAAAMGRDEVEVSAALGEPKRLGQEMRAAIDLQRWQERHTPVTFANALIALLGLAALDAVILLPLFVAILLLLLFALVVCAAAILGLVLLASLFLLEQHTSSDALLLRALQVASLLSGAVGFGALLLILADAVLRGLGRLARSHYSLLRYRERPFAK